MKLNKKFFFNYFKTLLLSAAAVVFIMKFILGREVMPLDKMAILLLALTVLIFIGYFIAQKRKSIISKKK